MARTLAVHEKRQVLEVKSNARAKFFCSIRHFHISHDAPYLPPKFCMTFVFYFPEYYRNLAMIWVKTGEVWDHSNWTLNNALGLAPYSSCREILVTKEWTCDWYIMHLSMVCPRMGGGVMVAGGNPRELDSLNALTSWTCQGWEIWLGRYLGKWRTREWGIRGPPSLKMPSSHLDEFPTIRCVHFFVNDGRTKLAF